MNLEELVKMVSKYASHDASEPLLFEAYTQDGRPVRFQIGVPRQNQLDLVKQVLKMYPSFRRK